MVQVCTSTKRHFITGIVTISIFFLFIDEEEGEGSIIAPVSKSGVEVNQTKTNRW